MLDVNLLVKVIGNKTNSKCKILSPPYLARGDEKLINQMIYAATSGKFSQPLPTDLNQWSLVPMFFTGNISKTPKAKTRERYEKYQDL